MFGKERWTRRGGRLHPVWRRAHSLRTSARAHPAEQAAGECSAEESDLDEDVNLNDICLDLKEILVPPPQFRWIRRRRGSLRFCSTLTAGATHIYRNQLTALLRDCMALNMEMGSVSTARYNLLGQNRRWEDWRGSDDDDSDDDDDNDDCNVEEMRREPRYSPDNDVSREESNIEMDITPEIESRPSRKHSMSEMEYSTGEEDNNYCTDVDTSEKDTDATDKTIKQIRDYIDEQIMSHEFTKSTQDHVSSEELVSLYDHSSSTNSLNETFTEFDLAEESQTKDVTISLSPNNLNTNIHNIDEHIMSPDRHKIAELPMPPTLASTQPRPLNYGTNNEQYTGSILRPRLSEDVITGQPISLILNNQTHNLFENQPTCSYGEPSKFPTLPMTGINWVSNRHNTKTISSYIDRASIESTGSENTSTGINNSTMRSSQVKIPEEYQPSSRITRHARFTLPQTKEPMYIVFEHQFSDVIPGNDTQTPVRLSSVPVRAGKLHISAENVDKISIDFSQVTHSKIPIVEENTVKESGPLNLVPNSRTDVSNNTSSINLDEIQERSQYQVHEPPTEIAEPEPTSSAMTETFASDVQVSKALPPSSLPPGVRGVCTAPRTKTHRGTKAIRKIKDATYRPPAHCTKAIRDQQPTSMALRKRSSDLKQSATSINRAKIPRVETPQPPPDVPEVINAASTTSENFHPIASSSPSKTTKRASPSGQLISATPPRRRAVELEFCTFPHEAKLDGNLDEMLAGTSRQQSHPISLERRIASSTTDSNGISPEETHSNNDYGEYSLINLQHFFRTPQATTGDISSNHVSSTSPMKPCNLFSSTTRQQVVSPDSTIPDDSIEELSNETDETQNPINEDKRPLSSFKSNAEDQHESLDGRQNTTNKNKVSVYTVNSSVTEETTNKGMEMEKSREVLGEDTMNYTEYEENSCTLIAGEETELEEEEEENEVEEAEQEDNEVVEVEENEDAMEEIDGVEDNASMECLISSEKRLYFSIFSDNSDRYALSTIEECTEDQNLSLSAIVSEDENVSIEHHPRKAVVRNICIDSPTVNIGEVGRFSQSWKRNNLSDVDEICSTSKNIMNTEHNVNIASAPDADGNAHLTSDTASEGEEVISNAGENCEGNQNLNADGLNLANTSQVNDITLERQRSTTSADVSASSEISSSTSNSTNANDRYITVQIFPPGQSSNQNPDMLIFMGKMSDLSLPVQNELGNWFDSDSDE